jgi:hypothetical protein
MLPNTFETQFSEPIYGCNFNSDEPVDLSHQIDKIFFMYVIITASSPKKNIIIFIVLFSHKDQ